MNVHRMQALSLITKRINGEFELNESLPTSPNPASYDLVRLRTEAKEEPLLTTGTTLEDQATILS